MSKEYVVTLCLSLKYYHVSSSMHSAWLVWGSCSLWLSYLLSILGKAQALVHILSAEQRNCTIFLQRLSSPSTVKEKANTIGVQADENNGDRVDPLDPVWQQVITLNELVKLVCSPTITMTHVAYLNIVWIPRNKESIISLTSCKPHTWQGCVLSGYTTQINVFVRVWTLWSKTNRGWYALCEYRTSHWFSFTHCLFIV